MKKWFFRTVLLIGLSSLLLSIDLWASDNFLIAETIHRPFEAGFNETKFAKAITDFLNRASDVHDVVVVKDSKVVFEATKYPYQKDIPHSMMSCSKSVTSILTGIAIEEGFIESIDTPLYNWFPQLQGDALKSQLTIYHLLSMTTGVEWTESGLYGETDSYIQMLAQPDPIGFFLSKDLEFQPGTFFEYNSGATVLLGVILEMATGMDLLEYARTRLFEPLSIDQYEWLQLPSGIRNAASSLYLTAKEMAMIGFFMLKKGFVDGKQIVNQQWVELITKKNKATPKGPASSYGYGLSWWMNSQGGFSARGYGGQFILVYPEQQLIVVTTGGLFGNDFNYPDTILAKGILAALSDPVENESALNDCYDQFTRFKPKDFGIIPADLPFLNQTVEFDSESIVRWSNSEKENALDLHLVINGNVINTTLPLDGNYVQVDFGDFGNYRQNLAMIAINYLTNSTVELVVRRFQSPYVYRYLLRYFGEKASWTTYVSSMNGVYEQYSGKARK